MKRYLSILIPCYNYICIPIVDELSRQAQSIRYLTYEIVVIDDGSTEKTMVEVNNQINRMCNCRYVVLTNNIGRAAVRNRLAKEAQYSNLLFIDCKHHLPDRHFIERYLQYYDNDVVNGGVRIVGNADLLGGNLRFLYELSIKKNDNACERNNEEYNDFHTANFMVKKNVMQHCHFDESIVRYGYEDVLFGRQLKEKGYHITHIDNPVLFSHFESNKAYIKKTEEAMITLHEHREELHDYSSLLKKVDILKKYGIYWPVKVVIKWSLPYIRRRLEGKHPRVWLLQMYKLGYIINLT